MFLKLRALLAPFGITRYYTDKAGVYRRHLPPEQHTVGKLSMQKIERKHLTLRTRLKRLARKTLCFSRSCLMHDLLIGLYMNHVEFGCAVMKRNRYQIGTLPHGAFRNLRQGWQLGTLARLHQRWCRTCTRIEEIKREETRGTPHQLHDHTQDQYYPAAVRLGYGSHTFSSLNPEHDQSHQLSAPPVHRPPSLPLSEAFP